MARARTPITWQNIVAPSNAAANALLVNATDGIKQGFQDAGDSVQAYADNRSQTETDAFIATLNAADNDQQRNEMLQLADRDFLNVGRANEAITAAQDQDFKVAADARAEGLFGIQQAAEGRAVTADARDILSDAVKLNVDKQALKDSEVAAAQKLITNPLDVIKKEQDITLAGINTYAKLQAVNFAEEMNPLKLKETKQLVENAKVVYDKQLYDLEQAKLLGPLSIKQKEQELSLQEQKKQFDRIEREENRKFNRLARKSEKLKIRDAKDNAERNKKKDARLKITQAQIDKINRRAEDEYNKNKPVKEEALRQKVRKLERDEKDWQDNETAKADAATFIANADDPNVSYEDQVTTFNNLEAKYRKEDYSNKNMQLLNRERTRLLGKADVNVAGLLDGLIPEVSGTVDGTGNISTTADIKNLPTKYFTRQVKRDLNIRMLDDLQEQFPGSTREELQPTATRILGNSMGAGVKFNETEENTVQQLKADDILRTEGLDILKNNSTTEKGLRDNPVLITAQAIKKVLSGKNVVLEEKDLQLLDKDLPKAMDKVKSVFAGTNLGALGERNLRLAMYQMFQNVQFKDGIFIVDAYTLNGKDIEDLTNLDVLNGLRQFASTSLKSKIDAQLQISAPPSDGEITLKKEAPPQVTLEEAIARKQQTVDNIGNSVNTFKEQFLPPPEELKKRRDDLLSRLSTDPRIRAAQLKRIEGNDQIKRFFGASTP